MNLLNKKCIPCEVGSINAFNKSEAEKYLLNLPSWKLSENVKKISKEFNFKDFVGAISFINKVANVAENEAHHPDIKNHYNKVLIELWTHAIGGLSENDFIVAEKIENI